MVKIGKNYKVIILDFVKTLVRENLIWDKLREINSRIFKKYGIDVEPQSLRPIIEQTASQIRFLTHLKYIPKKILQIEKELIYAQQTFEEESIELFSFYPDSIPFLNYADRMNRKIGILTNNSSQTVKQVFSKFKFQFNGEITGREDVRQPKPNSEGIIKLLKKLNAKPGESIVIGDSDFDIDAAKQIGIFAVFINRLAESKLSYAKADLEINSLSEISFAEDIRP